MLLHVEIINLFRGFCSFVRLDIWVIVAGAIVGNAFPHLCDMVEGKFFYFFFSGLELQWVVLFYWWDTFTDLERVIIS
uniref:Uncharacterized protein n=1 Tax=Manihot esculenta TaxID=3983 RepID=A0A2C9W3L9_MANES